MTVRMDRLDNGIRVITHQMPHLETASLGVWVNAGSRTEADHEHGVSHFLEHMVFKGTPTRTAKDIVEAIESVGGDINASTSLDTTCYYVRVLKDDVSGALEILGDFIQQPLFDQKELEREKNVVIQEIAASHDSPEDLVYDYAHQAAYSKHAVGRPILGTIDSVSSFDEKILRDYMKTHYCAGNMVVSAAGAVDHDDFVRKVKDVFSTSDSREPRSLEPAIYQGGFHHYDEPFEQSHLIWAFEGCASVDKNYIGEQVFSMLLGGGMSSRLFQEAREEKGLCYSIYSFCWGMVDTGLFGIHAATTPDQLAELSGVIVNQLKSIAENAPHEDEVARAKAQLKAGTLMNLESTGSRAEQLARQVQVYGQPIEISDLIERVNQVTSTDIRDIAQHIISNSVPTCSGVGSLGDFQGYDWFEKQIRS